MLILPEGIIHHHVEGADQGSEAWRPDPSAAGSAAIATHPG